jgi:glycosyltransferase involved in cell wall biosynthesis
MGSGNARNQAVARSRAEYLAFLDDDDQWHPGKIAREMDELMSASNAVVAVVSGYEAWAHGRLVLRDVPDPAADLHVELLAGPTIAPSTVLMRRSAFDQVGGFDAALSRIEDWDLWVRLLDRFEIVRIPDVLTTRSAVSSLPPDEALAYEVGMEERLRPAIEALPPSQRSWVRARHAFRQGLLQVESGRRLAGARQLWTAWRLDPSWGRPLIHLPHALVGERIWAHARRAASWVRR